MTTGVSGSYAIQGTDLSLQPTTGRWIDRPPKGFDGNGHPVYPGVREFELTWQLISMADIEQIQNFFNTVSSTGTVAVDLPQFNASPYQFYRYSGTTLGEPTLGEFFEKHETTVTMLIYGIRT